MASGVFRQWIAAIAALLSAISSATCFGWIAPILVDLLGPDSEVPMTEPESSWMISVIEIGNLISPIPAGILGDRWGRKPCILATGPFYFISWIIVLTTNTVEALYVVRILQGAIMGFMFTLVPVYLSEIASANIRGTITSSFFIAWYFGYMFEFCAGSFMSYKMFTAVTAVWPILQILLFFWQPESPYFLLKVGRTEEAAKSLSTLRMLPVTDQTILDELEEIKSSLNSKEGGSSWINLIKSPLNRKHLFVVSFVSFVAIMTGGYSIMSYSAHIFNEIKITFIRPHHFTITLGAFLFVVSFFPSVFVDKLGRRPLLLISTIGCTISLSICSVFFYFQELDAEFAPKYFYVLILSILLYFMFWSFGLLPVFVTYQSELFETSTRGNASSIIAFIITIFSFINLKSYSPIARSLGYCTLFGMYSAVALIGTVGVYLIAPETKGKTLAEIQSGYKKQNFIHNGELRSSLLDL